MKRKLIVILSLVLVIALSLGILASCQKGLKTEQLDKLFTKFTTQHKDDPKESPSSYWVDGSVFYYDEDGKEVSAKIRWTIEGTNLVTVGAEPNSMGGYQVIIPEGEQSEAVNYKLVGTLVDENDNAYTNADGVEYKLEISKTIPAGKTYKLAIRQVTAGKILYVMAEKNNSDGHYLKTIEQATGGADFHTEDVEGGKKIYTISGGKKCYLGVVKEGSYINLVLGGILHDTDAAAYQGSVWTVTNDAISTVLEGKTLYLGTSGTYTTCSVGESNNHRAILVEAGTEIKSIVQVKVSAQSKNCTVAFTSHTADADNVVAVEADTVVKFTVTPAEGYEVVSVKNGIKVITATDGTYSITADKSASLVVETRLIGSNGSKSPVEGVCANQEIPVGWTYISNNPEQYPNPNFYSTNGKAGLQIRYKDQGIESPALDGATDEISVKVNIYALNASQTNKEANGEHFFKVIALDAEGQEVAVGYIDTFNVGYNNEVVLNVGENIVKKVQVLLVEQPAVGGYAQNINLGGVRIAWGEPTATIGEAGYKTLDAALEAAQANDTIVLQKNVVVTTNIVVGKKITLDLNGKTISNTVAYYSEPNKIWSLISVRENGELTITGNGKLDALADDVYAVDVRDGGKLTIEDGEYIGNISAIYVTEGSAVINGGKYSIIQLDTKKGTAFTLNLLDANGAAGTATITVTGGQFVNYNPAASASEDPVANFVAEGYVSTSKTEGEGEAQVTIWTVEKESAPSSGTKTIVIEEYATANSWTNGTQYLEVKSNCANIVVTYLAEKNVNSGKYYTSGQNWRFYQAETPTITITAEEGYIITSVTITYGSAAGKNDATGSEGKLTLNGEIVASEQTVTVNAAEIAFGVGNVVEEGEKGNIQISSIVIVYAAAETAE